MSDESIGIMSRKDHLQWCKDRACEYLDRLDYQNAMASMASDMGKHPELRNHIGLQLMIPLLFGQPTIDEVRRWITGFN